MKGNVVVVIAAVCGLVSIATSLPTAQLPNPGEEDQHFWRKEGQEHLQRRLQLLSHLDPSSNLGAKNVIVFIGDGMGISTLTAARIYKGQKAKSGRGGEEAQLLWELWPFTGFAKTYNTDYQVPDSAGTATAIFSGVKTRLGVLGIDSIPHFNSCDPHLVETSKLQNVLHLAQNLSKETGIVTNSRITHATPAALYAHTQNRDWENDDSLPEDFRYRCQDIASQLVYGDSAKKIHVLFGGGLRNFKLKSDGGKRIDADLLEAWKAAKVKEEQQFDVLLNNGDLSRWQHSDFVLGLFADSHLPFLTDRDTKDEGSPSVSEMTRAALLRLTKSKKGFFLMVENGQIDGAHHFNHAKKALEEVLDLETAVQVAMEMTDPKETLIVVTADHSHTMTINGYPKRGNPILGYIYDESSNLVMTQPDKSKSAYTTLSYANGPGFHDHYTGQENHPWLDVRDLKDPELNKEFRQPTLWEGPEQYETHGGEDVGIFAIGPMAHLFSGVHEQNYIGHVLEFAMTQWDKNHGSD